ncbi:MAG TPA: LacI family DNA-binding transcriptional regulator [Baekduia sp.]|nr:LacI family DNA-binding transcriptional regulator [Baekduia sp.]
MSDATPERPAGGGRRKPAVMSDVARLAGVSHQTVSRVINGSDQVRPATRDRVLAAMRKLDYRPNPVARALVTGRSLTLGVVTFNTTLFGPASTLVGVERAAAAAGYAVSIVSLESLDREAVEHAIMRLRVQGVDGVVVIAPQAVTMSALWDLPGALPVVAVEAGDQDGVPSVAVAQHQGARLATEHLLALGHKTVHHLAGPSDWIEARQRIEGWLDALHDAGASSSAPLRGDWSPRSGYELGRRIVDLPDLTAVFVANDQMALGLLRLLREHGRDVPGDVSVVGFDDIPEAAYFTPPLTTVRQDFNEMGRRSLHVLLDQIAGGDHTPLREIVPATLVERASTAPPRAA